jgi:hypothetical protein
MQSLTNDDVRTLLPLAPLADPSTIEEDIDSIRSLLLIFGVDSRQRLVEFVKSKDIFDYLADVYRRELLRTDPHPLDWTDIAVWGAILFSRGLRDDVKYEIEKRIRESDEYKRKHSVPSGAA